MENPANTGCRIHGDFSAPIVSEAGTTGDSPAAITRISSGVIAAVARQPTASTTIATRPAQPYSPRADPDSVPRPRTIRPTRRTNVTPAKPTVRATAAPARASTSR